VASVTTAAMPLLSQVSQLPELRELRLPDGVLRGPSPLDDWRRIWDLNSAADGTLLPGHNAQQARRFLLDLSDPRQQLMDEVLRSGQGARVVSASPSGRYVLLESPEHGEPATSSAVHR
jgi:hypothetical protein